MTDIERVVLNVAQDALESCVAELEYCVGQEEHLQDEDGVDKECEMAYCQAIRALEEIARLKQEAAAC